MAAHPFGKEAFDPDSHCLRGAYDVDGRLLFVSPASAPAIVPMRLGVPPEISRLTQRVAERMPADGAMLFAFSG